MTLEQVLFFLTAIATLTSALMVTRARRLIHAALWLIATLFGVAVLYAILQAAFLVVVQIVIYIGAIAVLFIFAIMLTQHDLRDSESPARGRNSFAFLISLCLLGSLTFLVFALPKATSLPPVMPANLDTVKALGVALLSPSGYALSPAVLFNEGYALPFEVASVLLLAALVGAVYAATIERDRGKA